MKEILLKLISQSKWLFLVVALHMVLRMVGISRSMIANDAFTGHYAAASLVVISVTAALFLWNPSFQRKAVRRVRP